MKKFLILFVALSLLFNGCVLKNQQNSTNDDSNEIRAVWISYYELEDIISSSDDISELKEQIEGVVKKCRDFGLNRIILHVRAFSDAFYSSDVYPTADCLENKINKDSNYDPLKLFCDYAKENNIFIDAWINPYRISNSNDTEKVKQRKDFDEIVDGIDCGDIVISDNGIYFNPSSKQAQLKIISGTREILSKYPVDGIHIDDYFYPTTSKDFDEKSYNEYLDKNGSLSLEDWRRENVNALVSQLYSVTKSFGEEKTFSVSPGGDISYDYNECYADVKLWCSQKGYADYIIPQIYFGFENERMPFETVLKQWNEFSCDGITGLCFGLAFYKCNEIDEYAFKGKNEWKENSDIISRQINLCRQQKNYAGISLYSYSSMFSEKNIEKNKNELQNVINVL